MCDHPLLVSEKYNEGGSVDDISVLLGEMHLDKVKCSFCQYVSRFSVIYPISSILSAFVSEHSVFCDECKNLQAANAQLVSGNIGQKPTSAKIRKIVALLQEIDRRSGKTEKSIIFSQFIGMLDMIRKALLAEDIKFVRCRCSSAKVCIQK